MYSTAVFNYFHNNKSSKKLKHKKKLPPRTNTCKKKNMKNVCSICKMEFSKQEKKQGPNTKDEQSTGNRVLQKVLSIWKYARSFLSTSETARAIDNEKCSFKVIAHKRYKKRSLYKEVILSDSSSETGSSSTICNKCRGVKNQHRYTTSSVSKTTTDHCTDRKKRRNYRRRRVVQDNRRRPKLCDKKCHKKTSTSNTTVSSTITSSDESDSSSTSKNSTTTTESSRRCLRGRKRRLNLCTRSSRSSFKRKRQKCSNISVSTKTSTSKTVSSKKKPKKKKNFKRNKNTKNTYLIKNKVANYKKGRSTKKNKKKVNRFDSWQYMQYALNSISDDYIPRSLDDDERNAPVYLTYEEYCLILKAIDTRSSYIDESTSELETTTEPSLTSVTHTAVSTETIYKSNGNLDSDYVPEDPSDVNILLNGQEELRALSEHVLKTTEHLDVSITPEELNEIDNHEDEGEALETTPDQLETTAAPIETTAAPFETTAAPIETTAAPFETTAAPKETTAAPKETTAAPFETTADQLETTAEPFEAIEQLNNADENEELLEFSDYLFEYIDEIIQNSNGADNQLNVDAEELLILPENTAETIEQYIFDTPEQSNEVTSLINETVDEHSCENTEQLMLPGNAVESAEVFNNLATIREEAIVPEENSEDATIANDEDNNGFSQ